MYLRIAVFLLSLGLYVEKSFTFLSVEIVKISQDQKGLILSVGSADGVKGNDDGKLYKFDGRISSLVADLSAVKSNNTHSYWIVKKFYEKQNLQQGQFFQFEFLSNEFRNRKFPTVQVSTSVQKKDVVNEQEGLLKDPIFEEKLFRSQNVDEEQSVTSSETIHRKRQKFYQTTQEDSSTVLKPSVSKVINTRQVRENVTKKKFHGEVASFVNKFNKSGRGLAYNLDTGFDDRNMHFYPKSRDINDPLWSKALDRQELRAFLMSGAIVKEKQWRDTTIRTRFTHEIFMKYATALQPYADESSLLYQWKNFSISFGYEYFLGRHFSRLKNFSIKGFYTKGQKYFTWKTNTNVNYSGIGGKVQYYFYNDPHSIEKFMFFVGLGTEIGTGTFKIRAFNDNFSCNFLSLLTNVGVKYRFKDIIRDKGTSLSLGSFLLFGNRRTQYSINNFMDELIWESFDTDIQSSENKIYLGMSLYF